MFCGAIFAVRWKAYQSTVTPDTGNIAFGAASIFCVIGIMQPPTILWDTRAIFPALCLLS
jgi:hypothetical protein